MSLFPVITIDGPSGVGKGTMASLLATRLGWHFLDSGALYRLLALQVIQEKINFSEVAALVKAVKSLDIDFKATRIYLNQQDVTAAIRDEAVGLVASKISIFTEVRQALLQRQRACAQAPGLVADGRDMGSIVFPQACLKFYLDASAEVRAQRRQLQLKAQGISVKLQDLLRDIQKRDQQDQSRLVAPLVVPSGAIKINTDLLSKEQVFEKILCEVQSSLELTGGA